MRHRYNGTVMFAAEVKDRFGIDLAPCPFCASTARVGLYMPGIDPHVTCTACDADGPAIKNVGDRDRSSYRAALAWNRRPVPTLAKAV